MKRGGVAKKKTVVINGVRTHIFKALNIVLKDDLTLPLIMVGSKTGDMLNMNSNPDNKKSQNTLKMTLEGLFKYRLYAYRF
jgi:hypothetical protein